MNKRLLTLFCWLGFLTQAVMAGTPIERSLMVGVGHSSQLDTYLSPLEYKGTHLNLLRETMRQTRWADNRLYFHQLLDGAISMTKSPAENANDLGGRIGYDAGWLYHWQAMSHLCLQGGGLAGVDFGGLYNNRNGNNPVQVRGNLDLSASVGAVWDFRLLKKTCTLQYKADLPIIGGMFSPQYGQSYYEIYQGDNSHNVCFTYPGNALSLRQRVMLDIALGKASLRIGYLNDVRQSHVNEIKAHDICHSFLIGYVKRFSIL